MRLDGLNGGLYILGRWIDLEGDCEFTVDRGIHQSLSHFYLSGTQRLAITKYRLPTVDAADKSAPYHTLSRMEDPRTLTLTQCNNLPFILALNPDRNSLRCTLCPKLEDLVLHFKGLESSKVEELMSMTKERASAGMKLSSIVIASPGELMLGKVFKLEEYVTHVDYRVGKKPPIWDALPGDEVDCLVGGIVSCCLPALVMSRVRTTRRSVLPGAPALLFRYYTGTSGLIRHEPVVPIKVFVGARNLCHIREHATPRKEMMQYPVSQDGCSDVRSGTDDVIGRFWFGFDHDRW